MQTYGPYIVQDTIGRGGMGTVYRGKHRETGDEVAIKVLSKEYGESEHFRVRFEAEIETLFKLHHPNIVQLISYGQEHGEMFFAMELVAGRSLYAEQRITGRFHWRDVILMTLDVCAGLRHAHDRGVIHRDIKPGNLLLGPKKIVKITDFGIAKLFGGVQLTAHGGVVGTADFMSPEQAKGEMVTQRSDLYSLGAVMFVLLTKRPPLPAKSMHEAIHNLTSKKPPRVTQLAPGIPEQLSQVISRLLEKDPEKRIGTALALSKRLHEILEELKSKAEAKTESASIHHDFELPEESVKAGKTKAKETSAPTEVSLSPANKIDESSEFRTVELSQPAKPKTEQAASPDVQPTIASEIEDLKLRPLDDDNKTQQSTPQDTAQNTAKQSYFTEVDTSRKRITRPRVEPKQSIAVIWPYVAGLAFVVALAVVGIIFVLMQAPDADTLYETIAARADNPSAVKQEIKEFLERFPDDVRASQVQYMLFQADSRQHIRRLELKAKLSGPVKLLPIENAFLMALRDREIDPSITLIRLQAVAQMYESNQDDMTLDGMQCLSAILGQINLLTPIVEEYESNHRAAMEATLKNAQQLTASDPLAAKRACQGVIEVYRDKAWAQDLVEQATERLKEAEAALAKQKPPAENDAAQAADKSSKTAESDPVVPETTTINN